MIVTLDWETYFDAEYSLSKMTTEAYVRDPRFKVHGLAIKYGAAPAGWLAFDNTNIVQQSLPYLRDVLSRSAVLCHHAQFDGLILNHHFGIRPKLWLDTLSMARIALPHHRHSLDKLSQAFGLPGKQHQKLADVKGVRDPSPAQLQALGEMACDDADKTYKIFQQIKDYIPREEFAVIDMTIRMFTEPCLELDVPKLSAYHKQVVAQKADTLAKLGVSREILQSADKFADVLRSLGVEPPVKTSPKGNTIFAFAKTDEGMRELLDSDNDDVAAVAAARLGIKSTLNETRCERLLSMSSRGRLPVYLRYAGAHTSRWSGGDSLNWQNFPRLEADKSPGQIRGSIKAPPGYKLVVADLAQIECRMLNWLAGEQRVLDEFRAGADVYSNQASRFYGRTITKADKIERQIFKSAEVGCGYGMGAPRFEIYCKQSGVPIDTAMAQSAVGTYRETHPFVTRLWKNADFYLNVLRDGGYMSWGPMEVADGAIWLPNGIPLWYDKQKVGEEGDRRVLIRGQWRYMYGPKLVENVVQALSRVVLSQAMVRIAPRYRPVNTTHDEVIVLAPVDDAEALPYVCSELKATPTWAPGLPLDAEGSEGERYSK